MIVFFVWRSGVDLGLYMWLGSLRNKPYLKEGRGTKRLERAENIQWKFAVAFWQIYRLSTAFGSDGCSDNQRESNKLWRFWWKIVGKLKANDGNMQISE
jgi:hypothetical protein